MWVWQWPKIKFDARAALASPKVGQRTKARLEANFIEVTSADDEAAKFAFEESKSSYNLTRERFKSLDGKAVTLTGVVTTGLGAIAFVGDPTKMKAHEGWLYFSVAALSISLVVSLLSLAPAGVANPDLSAYVWPKTLANVDNLARIRIALARDWLRDAATIKAANAAKVRYLRVATICLVAGLFGLVTNYLIQPVEKPLPTLRIILPTPLPSGRSPDKKVDGQDAQRTRLAN